MPAIDQHIDLTREISLPGDVCFDPESMKLHGFYSDELSAYRARKTWVETLENCFLLEPDHDFTVAVDSDMEAGKFSLSCEFLSACARYAFWRLTNHQAPEAQYMIETAHIPNSDSHQEDILAAPDLKSLMEDSLEHNTIRPSSKFVEYLRQAVDRLITK